MQQWVFFAGSAVVLWGLWAFFGKLASQHIDPRSVFFYESLMVAIAAGILFLSGFRPQMTPKGILFGVLTGITLALGHIIFFIAISKGKASLTVTLTALYPVITLLLAFLILREHVTLSQGLGIGLALVAMYLMAS